ncbi:hypothetical protein F5B18DRAFT_94120 [Nemania serpens]|nr:hypothetical protein F5B18DRAFT_94120 [Nemania serpens]
MTRGEFQKEMKCIEREIGELLVEGIHMRTSTYEIAAKEVDTERWNKLAYAEDCSYIELLASRLKEPSGSTVTMKNPRDPNKQDRWRKAVIKAYGSEHARGTRVWCPINQQYEAPGGITAAHIVRYNVGELAAAHLFGPLDDSAGHIWSIRNGIPLTSRYEEMLDDGRIAIVPTKDGKDLMVAVLDEAERSTLLLDPTAMDPDQVLHGRTLMFLNDHRPALRYLYFCFAMNLLRRQKFEVDGWWKDRIEYADTPFFPTPGKWVRETTLRKLAIRIGYLPAGEADNFAAMTQARNPEGLSREGEAAVGEEAKEAKEAKEEDKEEDKEEENKEEEFTISRVHYAFLDLDPAPEPD